jgi:hypothetical protein
VQKVQITPVTLIAGAVLIALAYIWLRGVKGVASDVSQFVVSTAEGVVIGAGKTVGIPETDAKMCEQYTAAGEWWNASFYCPAGTFLKSAAGAVIDTQSGETVGYTDEGEPEIIMLN